MRRPKGRTAALVLLAAAWVIALASLAWAPRSWGLVAISADCTSGDIQATESFAISLQRFEAGDDEALAVGTITIRCGVDNPIVSNVPLETPVEVTSASCESATLELADVSIDVDGYDDPVTIELGDESIQVTGGDGRLKGALCNLAKVSERDSLRVLVGALNRLLG